MDDGRRPAVQRWEYLTLVIDVVDQSWRASDGQVGALSPDDSSATVLNRFGREGWELVSAAPASAGVGVQAVAWAYDLKRPLP